MGCELSVFSCQFSVFWLCVATSRRGQTSFRFYNANPGKFSVISFQSSVFLAMRRAVGVPPKSAVRSSACIFGPEPQGYWEFRPGVGGALTVLQCEPREAVSYQRSAVSFFAMRLVVGVPPKSAVRSSVCIFGRSRRGIGSFGPVSAAL